MRRATLPCSLWRASRRRATAAARCTGFRQPDTGRRTPWDLHIDGNTVYQDVPAVASFNTVEAEVAAVLATRERGIDMYDAQRTHLLLRVRNFIDFVVAAKTRAALA